MSKLVKCDDILYKSDPFGDFDTDCETCQLYLSNGSMTIGGNCKLYNIKCGYGFTCNDYKNNPLCELNKPHIIFDKEDR